MPEINIIEEGKKLFDVEIAAMETVKMPLMRDLKNSKADL